MQTQSVATGSYKYRVLSLDVISHQLLVYSFLEIILLTFLKLLKNSFLFGKKQLVHSHDMNESNIINKSHCQGKVVMLYTMQKFY